MIGMFALSAVGRGFELRLLTAMLSIQLQDVTSKTGWLKNRFMCECENLLQ
jgi:hypothetical protein